MTAIKPFAFPAKMLILEPVLPYMLEEWISKNIPAKYCQNIRKNGGVITSSPEHTDYDKLSLRSCWDIVQKMKLGFWRKWKIDYLSTLQNRTKWKSPNNNFKVGEIVIIKEDNIPPATWPLGKLIETHPGKDGVMNPEGSELANMVVNDAKLVAKNDANVGSTDKISTSSH
ncbi:DUF5641 domain-containing protein [Trichonephila clavipes]|nr:DUF5641 domain-containing protein [Trichonephila clavipes]